MHYPDLQAQYVHHLCFHLQQKFCFPDFSVPDHLDLALSAMSLSLPLFFSNLAFKSGVFLFNPFPWVIWERVCFLL